LALLFAIAAAVLVAALAGVFDSRLPARLPADVLLLPQGLLSGLLPRPHSLCGGRATARLSGRDEVPLHPPERAPVLHVRRCRVHLHSLVRRAPRPPLARERRAGRRRVGATQARAQRARAALVCKSLLGKAHTVMAEGAAAAALGNVMEEDNWRVHFRDTMRGGKMHNNWRMAQIHAQEAPDRIRELEA